jgi:hypothetical protein
MNSLPFGSHEVVANKGNGRRRAEQIQEADEIYKWLVFQQGLAVDVIRASAKLVRHKGEAADARRLRINGKPCSKAWRCLILRGPRFAGSR